MNGHPKAVEIAKRSQLARPVLNDFPQAVRGHALRLALGHGVSRNWKGYWQR